MLRSRTVLLDLDQLRQSDGSPASPGTILELNLFPGETLSVRIDKISTHLSGGYSLIGSIVDQPLSQVLFAVHGNTVTASLRMPGLLCELRPMGDGSYGVYDLDPDAYPGDSLITLADLPDTSEDPPSTMQDDGSLIDVLVVYTASARQGAGSTSAMESLIDLAESLTNTSLSDSGVTPRIRVVHREEVSYSESGFSYSGALNDLRDGDVPNVLALRDQYGADLVAMIVEGDTSLCGIAFFMSSVSSAFAGSAFSVTKRTCATGNMTFAHEIGHNLGARHQREADSDTGPFTFNYGFADSTNNFRTIMGIATGSCSSCPRISHWSNPDVTFSGNPTGSAEGNADSADNRKTLNQTAATAAAFRDAVIPEAGDFAPNTSVMAPFWQAGTGFYSFIAVTHPSLSGLEPDIGVRVSAILSGGGLFDTAKEFTLSAGQTHRIFIVPSNHSSLTQASQPTATVLAEGTSGIGYVRFDPVSTSPTTLSGNGGFPDVTMLGYWGAVVFEDTFTGFALEFLGDLADSVAHPGLGSNRFASGLN